RVDNRSGRRVAESKVPKSIGHQHCHGVGLLPGRTTGAPHLQGKLLVFVFLAQQIFKNVFMEEVELGLVAEETGFIDRKVFQQPRQLFFSLVANQQAVVTVEGIDLPLFEPALQSVFEEVGAALVEKHAASLVHQVLQELEL